MSPPRCSLPADPGTSLRITDVGGDTEKGGEAAKFECLRDVVTAAGAQFGGGLQRGCGACPITVPGEGGSQAICPPTPALLRESLLGPYLPPHPAWSQPWSQAEPDKPSGRDAASQALQPELSQSGFLGGLGGHRWGTKYPLCPS